MIKRTPPCWFTISTYATLVSKQGSLSMRQANEKRRYSVTSSLIGWSHTQTGPWVISSLPHANQVRIWGPLCKSLNIRNIHRKELPLIRSYSVIGEGEIQVMTKIYDAIYIHSIIKVVCIPNKTLLHCPSLISQIMISYVYQIHTDLVLGFSFLCWILFFNKCT